MDVMKTWIRTLSHVPKAAQTGWARLLTDLLWAVNNDPSNDAHYRLLMLAPACILNAPPRGGKSHQRQLASIITGRIARWRNGEISALWNEATSPQQPMRNNSRRKRANLPSRSPEEEQAEANRRRCHRLVQDFQYSRGVQALTSRGIDQSSLAAYNAMVEKHPQRTLASSGEDLPPPLVISAEQVKSALLSFRPGTAPGPSGLRADHLKSALKAHSPARGEGFLYALTKFCNILASGKAPRSIAPHFFGASLFAANKKDGGHRPIAVGEVLRRLVSKCLAFESASKAAELLAPLQVGVGVRNGIDAAVHAVRSLIEDQSVQANDKWVLQLDFANAFNTVDRNKVFEAVRSHFPELSAWVESCYGGQAFLIFGNAVLTGTTGLHQGDPLGPLLFALAIFPLAQLVKSEVPSLLFQLWYLDDETLIGSKDDLVKAYDIVAAESPSYGLLLAPNKSSIWGPTSDADPLGRGVPLANPDGFELLGSPIGSDAFIGSVVDKRVAKIAEALSLLPTLEDSHVEFALLRSCLSLPKFSFVLRTCHPSSFAPSLQAFNGLMRDSLASIIGASLDDRIWSQACLPVSLGGVGLRSVSHHSAAAYAVSVAHSSRLSSEMIAPRIYQPKIERALDILNGVLNDPLTLDEIKDMPQRRVSHQVDLFLQSTLFASASQPREKARFGSVSLPHSGDWLNAVPSKVLNLHMRPLEFRVAIKYRLGLPIYSSEGICPAGNCDRNNDIMGDHAIGCAYLGERTFRHNLLRDAIHSAAQAACLNPAREIRGLLPGSEARPADVFLPSWVKGHDAALDVTVISPLQQNLVDRCANDNSLALDTAHRRKMTARFEDCRSVNVVLVPLAVETFGGWHPAAAVELKRIASRLARQTNASESVVISHFFQKLAVCLQRTNASLLLSRQTCFPPSEIDGH